MAKARAASPQSLLLSAVWLAIAAMGFAGLTWFSWNGRLGWVAMALLVICAVALILGRRGLSTQARNPVDLIAKTAFTIVGSMALLRHPIPIDGGRSLPIYSAILDYIDQVDPRTFLLFALIAMLVKLVGVISSAYAWHLLLIGQGVRFRFWVHIMTAFLIGRFIGTFLPSTIGLDGYTLYEAGRYSNQWSRVITAKALEKIIGSTGLFLGMVLTLPFGYGVIAHVTQQIGRPQAAPLFAATLMAVAGGISAVVIVGLVWPVLLTKFVTLFGRLLPGGVRGQVDKFIQAVGAYHGQVGLLMTALFSKFVTHFTTAAVYYFTALAIGVVGAEFWPIVFGSTIQILATVLSPTIAGEGAREAFQALLLSKHLGGVAQAVLSAALGFFAAEAATLWGGLFMWIRTPEWRPQPPVLVDGRPVDYAWIPAGDETDFRTADLAALSRGR